MTVVVLITALVPFLAAAAWLAARGRGLRFTEDRRGIALQTVIIMVVLIAIAGGVAAVLLSRGGSSADQLQNTKLAPVASEYGDKYTCEAAGKKWSDATQHCWE